MPDKLTDNDIVKAKELIKMLREAYNAYYDTSKGMPYNIDETLRESAFCLENCLNEINRLQAENERLKNNISAMAITLSNSAKATRHEAHKEFWKLLKVRANERFDYYTPSGCDLYFSNGMLCGYSAMKEAGDNLLKELVGK